MTIKYKILIADRSHSRSQKLEQLFTQQGYDCIVAGSTPQALSLFNSHCPDIMVMDADLPRTGAAVFIDRLRIGTLCPIIVLSGRDSAAERIAAFDAGADDYILRPVSDEELLARCRRALKRAISAGLDAADAYEGVFSTGGLSIDYRLRKVYVDGVDVRLTQREYRIVALLGCHAGKVVEYGFIMQQLWGSVMPDGNQILRVNMANIRRKLGEDPQNPKYIFTHPGVGYSLAGRCGKAEGGSGTDAPK